MSKQTNQRIEIIRELAARLGVRPTQADPSTEVWECYADRVRGAAELATSGKLWEAAIMIVEANAYAVPAIKTTHAEALERLKAEGTLH